MCCNDVTIHIKPPMCTRKDAFHVEEQLFVSDETDRIDKILDAKYKPANLNELMDNLPQLKYNQKEQLHMLINKQHGRFDGMLSTWKGSLYKIELQDDTKPHYARLYGIPHAYNQIFKQKLNNDEK